MSGNACLLGITTGRIIITTTQSWAEHYACSLNNIMTCLLSVLSAYLSTLPRLLPTGIISCSYNAIFILFVEVSIAAFKGVAFLIYLFIL